MPFPKSIREEALVKSQRHCCVCHEFAGRAINVHHIKQECDGGENTLENAIVLCLRCHSEAGHFNPRHPIGTSYSPSELIRHRDEWIKACARGTAIYSSSIQTEIKRTYLSGELHTYKLLVKIINGNENVISGWKLEVSIPSAIKTRAINTAKCEKTYLNDIPCKKYLFNGTDKVLLGDEIELLNLSSTVLEYDIDQELYFSERRSSLNIEWCFYSDVEPVKTGTIVWEDMQEF